MALYIIAAVCVALFSPLEVQAAADVTAPAGRVVGLEQVLDAYGTIVNAFLGIPFAHPPVGERRFRRAERLGPLDGIYNATRKPNACFQSTAYAFPGLEVTTALSEDCLYLNVWQPTPLPTAAAVMVWIYGGGFTTGSSDLDVYDGRYLAATEGVLVVSMNYRLGALGFAYTGTDEAPGNMGLTDQLLALQWVKDNIASFGGDPSKVTIFGESAGAMSVALHHFSPESRNVFDRGIMQSGTVIPNLLSSAPEGYGIIAAYAARLGCPTGQGPTVMMACMRQQDAQTLVATPWPFYPVVDGNFLPEHPSKALEDGNFKHTDILLGFNTNEWTVFFAFLQAPGFSFASDSNIDRELFVENIKSAFPKLNELAVDAVIFQYTDWLRLDDPSMYRDALDTLRTDNSYVCPAAATARAHTRVGMTAYMYEFAHRPSNVQYPAWVGVFHGAEIPFVFGWPLISALGYTAEEAELSRRMMRQWANFARTGKPNNSSESVWSPFTETSRGYLMLDTSAPRMVTGQKATECAFWDSYVPSLMTRAEPTAAPQQCETAVVESDTSAVLGVTSALLLTFVKDVVSFIAYIFAML